MHARCAWPCAVDFPSVGPFAQPSSNKVRKTEMSTSRPNAPLQSPPASRTQLLKTLPRTGSTPSVRRGTQERHNASVHHITHLVLPERLADVRERRSHPWIHFLMSCVPDLQLIAALENFSLCFHSQFFLDTCVTVHVRSTSELFCLVCVPGL